MVFDINVTDACVYSEIENRTEKEVKMKYLNEIEQILNKKDRTIPEICKELGVIDEFEVISRIADLESIGKVCLKGWNKFYQPDGCVGFIAVYGRAETTIGVGNV